MSLWSTFQASVGFTFLQPILEFVTSVYKSREGLLPVPHERESCGLHTACIAGISLVYHRYITGAERPKMRNASSTSKRCEGYIRLYIHHNSHTTAYRMILHIKLFTSSSRSESRVVCMKYHAISCHCVYRIVPYQIPYIVSYHFISN